MAEELSIDLLGLVNTGDPNVRSKIYAGTLISDTMIKGFSVRIAGTAFPIGDSFPLEPTILTFVDDNGNTATAYEIFAKLWNDSSDLSQVPGTYIYRPSEQHKKKILSLQGNVVPLTEVGFVYEVVTKHFFGNIELIEAEGLYNVRERTFQARGSLVTQKIIPYELEQIWEEVPDPDSVKNKVSFGLGIKSVLPDKPRQNSGNIAQVNG